MQINLSDKQTEAWHLLEDDETTEVLYGGAAGGGKSYLGCVWHIYRRTAYPESRGLIGRAKLSNLKESTLVTFFKVAKLMGYIPGVHFSYNGQTHKITWRNGSETILKDLFLYPSDPDFTSLGSTEFTDAFIDEGTEITSKAFEIVNSRLRWNMDKYNLIPKTLITCNPAPGWVKERYITDNNNQPIALKPYQKFVQSLVDDNPDESFVRLYKTQLERLTDEYDKLRLLYGDWDAQPNVERPFAIQFDPQAHLEEVQYQPGRLVNISIDFNINPFGAICSHVFRDSIEHCHVFDEITIATGTIKKMAEEIKLRFDVSNIQVTGDAMGANRTMTNDNLSLFDQLRRELGLRESQIKIRPNPKHKSSREQVNYFLYHFPDFKINPRTCPNLVRDCKVVQVDAFGQIIKRNRKDVSQLADHIDCLRYEINTTFGDWVNHHKKKMSLVR